MKRIGGRQEPSTLTVNARVMPSVGRPDPQRAARQLAPIIARMWEAQQARVAAEMASKSNQEGATLSNHDQSRPLPSVE
jgi:hypothetical protein